MKSYRWPFRFEINKLYFYLIYPREIVNCYMVLFSTISFLIFLDKFRQQHHPKTWTQIPGSFQVVSALNPFPFWSLLLRIDLVHFYNSLRTQSLHPLLSTPLPSSRLAAICSPSLSLTVTLFSISDFPSFSLSGRSLVFDCFCSSSAIVCWLDAERTRENIELRILRWTFRLLLFFSPTLYARFQQSLFPQLGLNLSISRICDLLSWSKSILFWCCVTCS